MTATVYQVIRLEGKGNGTETGRIELAEDEFRACLGALVVADRVVGSTSIEALRALQKLIKIKPRKEEAEGEARG